MMSTKTAVAKVVVAMGVTVGALAACSAAPTDAESSATEESAFTSIISPGPDPTCRAEYKLPFLSLSTTEVGCATTPPSSDPACCANHVTGYAIRTANKQCPTIALSGDRYWASSPVQGPDGDDAPFPANPPGGYTCQYLFRNIEDFHLGYGRVTGEQVDASALCTANAQFIGYTHPIFHSTVCEDMQCQHKGNCDVCWGY